MLIVDIEIANPIPPKDGNLIQGINYAKGWDFPATMGIACIGAYEYTTDKYHVFGEYETEQFQELINLHDCIVGFKNIKFDNVVLRTADIKIEDRKSYDILAEAQKQIGYQKGTTLNDFVKANFPNASGKNGDGAMAPVRWQQGYYTEVINYCLNDVRMTKMLTDRILRFGYVKNPLNPDQIIKMRRP